MTQTRFAWLIFITRRTSRCVALAIKECACLRRILPGVIAEHEAMASRRLQTFKAKHIPVPPPVNGRTRSATNPLSSTGEPPASQATFLTIGRSAKPQTHGDGESNIQVFIRCRRRSEREIQENSPIIVSSNGPKSHEITIETSAPVSSLGVITLPPTRTYPFDLVFGPEADQAMIYHDVVNPLLDEVLMGYNCTLFAYGQTGTGKTCVVRAFPLL